MQNLFYTNVPHSTVLIFTDVNCCFTQLKHHFKHSRALVRICFEQVKLNLLKVENVAKVRVDLGR